VIGRTLLVVLFEAAVAFGGWPRFGLPDPALAFSVQAGFRARDREDLPRAAIWGLASGLFSVEPWSFFVLLALAAAGAGSVIRRRLMPGRTHGVLLVFLAALAAVAALEAALRMSLPGLRFDARGALSLVASVATGAPVAWFADRAARRDELRFAWK
jgi:hypothetical protein